jgi:hypothetical protein
MCLLELGCVRPILQAFFRSFPKLAGMTGTAATEVLPSACCDVLIHALCGDLLAWCTWHFMHSPLALAAGL